MLFQARIKELVNKIENLSATLRTAGKTPPAFHESEQGETPFYTWKIRGLEAHIKKLESMRGQIIAPIISAAREPASSSSEFLISRTAAQDQILPRRLLKPAPQAPAATVAKTPAPAPAATAQKPAPPAPAATAPKAKPSAAKLSGRDKTVAYFDSRLKSKSANSAPFLDPSKKGK